MLDVLRLSGTTGIDIVTALTSEPDALRQVDATADLILMSRDALAAGLDRGLSKPDRVRSWTYEFDPSGLELLRRAIEHAAAGRPTEPLGV
jgi:hypothetical protein